MLDLSRRLELDWLAQLLTDVRAAAPGLEPLLVDALARDLLLHFGYGFEIERVTADVDFAIAVVDWDELSAIRRSLLASGLFESIPKLVARAASREVRLNRSAPVRRR